RHVFGESSQDDFRSRGRLSAWLQEQLFARRVVMVSGPLDDAAASETAAALMALDANGDTPIGLHIDSVDGTIEAAFVLIDTLDLIRSAVRALCRGQVGGPVIPGGVGGRSSGGRAAYSLPVLPADGALRRDARGDCRPEPAAAGSPLAIARASGA